MMEYTLRNQINQITVDKNSPYYNESLCNVIFDYMGSVHYEDFTKDDLKILEENGYELSDFIEE